MGKKTNKKWIRPIHKFGRALVYFAVYPFVKLKYRATIKKFTEENGGQYLILYNHQTPFDQFFVGMSLKGLVYYVCSDDVMCKGFISKVINFVVAPIPIKKHSSDARAIMNMLKVKKEGASIAIAPEGNRTYDGRTCYIAPSIAPLIKKLNLPVLIYKIRGGYGVQPRWSNVVRKSKITCGVSEVLNPSDYANLTDSELYEKVKDLLYVDENLTGGYYYHKKSAEYLERYLYVCPSCGLTHFKSDGNTVTCLSCGKKAVYNPDKTFSGDFGFKTVGEWSDYQKDFVRNLNIDNYLETPAYVDSGCLGLMRMYKRKKVLSKNAEIKLFGNRIEIDGKEYLFKDILTFTLCGRNKVNFYLGNEVYQIKGDKRFNGIKYLNFFYHHKNSIGGDNDEFLGL